MTLLVSYGSLVSLGTIEAFLKELPFYKGRGESDSVTRLESSVLGANVVAATAIVAIGLLFLWLVHWHSLDSIINPIRIMVAAAGLSLVSSFFYYRFVAHQDFKTLSFLDVARALLTMLMVVGLAHTWGLYGAATGLS